jgi:Acetyl-CoA hydrolase
VYKKEFQGKLTTPEEAVKLIKKGDMLVHGLTMAEPPALLSAVAERLREETLKKLKCSVCYPWTVSVPPSWHQTWWTVWKPTVDSWTLEPGAW